MDAAPPAASELSAVSRWSGHASPHELAQALSLLLPLLPQDCRARAACVCRAWRAVALRVNVGLKSLSLRDTGIGTEAGSSCAWRGAA